MSDNPSDEALFGTGAETPSEQLGPASSPSPGFQPDPSDALRLAVGQVMEIQDVTLGEPRTPLRFRGRLVTSASEAFRTLRPPFERLGYTPQLRREEGLDVVRALPGVFGRAERRTPWLNIILLIATILSVFYVGFQQELYIPIAEAVIVQITGDTTLASNPALLPTPAEFREALFTGALYALALLGILGAHEMGHYLMARRHGVHTTLPFFIPLPFNILGTLGAVIAMREPAPNRRIQFDIGIAGPLAGLIVAVPVMAVGLMLSQVGTPADFVQQMPEAARDSVVFFQEGQSLLYLAIKFLVFGRLLPSGDLDVWIHPVAFAAWAGFLVTALNLLPIGQLDGGHVMFGLFGEKVRRLRWPVIGVLVILAAAGSLNDAGLMNLPFGWSGWWLWVMMAVLLLRNHAPVLDEITELDSTRKALGVMMLVIFVLIFTPRPIVISGSAVTLLLGG